MDGAETAAHRRMGELIRLEGDAAGIGRTLGGVWAGALAADTDAFFARMADSGLDATFLIAEGGEYGRRLRDVAPHMLVELEATAEAAGVAAARFRAYMGLKYVMPAQVYAAREWVEPLRPLPPHGCTSFMATGTASGVPANLLHKNRDYRKLPQAAHVKALTGTRRVLGAGDVGDVGLCHGLNDAGLAGKMNSGDRIERPLRHSLSTTEVLRLVLETCATCEAALRALRELSAAGLISDGVGGCIWLFADRERGLIVEETPFTLVWEFVEDAVAARGNAFKRLGYAPGEPERPDAGRYHTALRTMRALASAATPADLNRLSRNTDDQPTPVCNGGTNSATTSVLPFDAAVAPHWEIALGPPDQTCYLPMSPAAAAVPRCILDGSLWRLTNRPDGAPSPSLAVQEAQEATFRARHAAATAAGPAAVAAALRTSALELAALLGAPAPV